MTEWVEVAKLLNYKPKDLGFTILCLVDPSLFLRGNTTFYLVPPRLDIARKLTIKSFIEKANSSYIVSFNEIDETQSNEIVNCKLLVDKSIVDDIQKAKSQVKFAGMNFRDMTTRYCGVISDVVENPAQALLLLKCDNGLSAYMPLVDEFIVEIDANDNVIVVKTPVGLFSVN